MDLALHRVDGRGRINLEGVVAPGTEFYMAEQADNGQIILKPVKVVTTAVKRAAEDETSPEPVTS